MGAAASLAIAHRHVGERARRLAGSLLVAAVAALTGCTTLPSYTVFPRDVPPPLTVGDDADGKTVSLTRGQRLFVRLPSQASSGYVWQVAFDNDLSAFPTADLPRLDDDGAVTVFSFRGDGVGKTKLRFSYVPSANIVAQPQKVVAFEVDTQTGYQLPITNWCTWACRAAS